MISSRTWRVLLMVIVLSTLTACGDSGLQDVKQWMDEARQQAKVSIPKLAEPKKFTPFVYSSKNAVDPFNAGKLAVAFAKMSANVTSKLRPDLDRRREPLESYPLDAIKMV